VTAATTESDSAPDEAATPGDEDGAPSDGSTGRGRAATSGGVDSATATVDADDGHAIETGRWIGISAMVLFAAGIGIAANSPGLLLAALVGVAFLGYARLSRPPAPTLSVTRTVEDGRPSPGDTVTVRLTVENEGERTLPDLRVVDGVPTELSVVEGSPRVGTALRPGQSVRVEYSVEAKRGTHEFDAVTVLARSVSGAHERSVRPAVGTRLTADPPLEMDQLVPLRGLTTPYTGRVPTTTGGEGIEFFATREYRRGDSLSRVDWNRLARDGELSTLEFREERLATVVLVPDLRLRSYVRGDDENLHAADRSIAATGELFSALLESGDRVGIAAIASEDVWLPPGSGSQHRARARELLATHPAFAPERPDTGVSSVWGFRTITTRLPPNAQVVLLSPLVDDAAFEMARRFDARGHDVTVVSPAPEVGDSVSERVGDLRRSLRIVQLREVGIRVAEWDPDERLASTLERAGRRWST